MRGRLLRFGRRIRNLAGADGLKKNVSRKEDHFVYKMDRIYRIRMTLSSRYSKKYVKVVVIGEEPKHANGAVVIAAGPDIIYAPVMQI